MEPMTLGSNPSSPSSPGRNPNYLPAFLMGENQQTPNRVLSPDCNKSYSQNLTPSNTTTLRQKLFSPNVVDSHLNQSQAMHDSGNKQGPPKQSLFDTIDTKKTPNSFRHNLIVDSPAINDTFSSSYNDSMCRTDAYNNLENVNENVTHNVWVTVFGFPNNGASLVLAQFANCGTIVDKKFPIQGNWVHIKFSSPLEAGRALAMNGKLISNTVMVGVTPYNHKHVDKENRNSLFYTSPHRARSLRCSFVSPQNSNTVLPPQNVPQKSTGLVTKAMEYMFGW